jgi:hypothetical protein
MRHNALIRIMAFLLAGCALYADLMFETVTKTDGILGVATMEISARNFFKPDRSRTETSATDANGVTVTMIIISRLDKKAIWILNPDLKTYTETRIDELKSELPVVPDSLGYAPDFKVEKTGKNKKILDKMCDEVVATMKITTEEGTVVVNQTLWLASDIPGYQDFFEYGFKIRELGLSTGLLANNIQDKKLKEFQEMVSNIYGFPLAWALDMDLGAGEMKFTMRTDYTVTNYASAPIDNNVFELPAGYKLQE